METKKQLAISNRMLRRKEIKVDFARNKGLYLLFIPVLIYYLIFAYGPLYGALIAFKDFSPVKGVMGSPWVGFKHFIRFFSIPTFWTVLRNTLTISISTLIFSFPMPIILALLMNELRSPRFAKIVQNATYLPHFISLVVTCGIVKDFVSDTGIVTSLLTHFGVPKVTLL
ncbi:MAG: sugar ABC transporter permease, partial [Clostridia bacterium]|nr:sugar ABC transporter permease [Clostridia bacterium]